MKMRPMLGVVMVLPAIYVVGMFFFYMFTVDHGLYALTMMAIVASAMWGISILDEEFRKK